MGTHEETGLREQVVPKKHYVRWALVVLTGMLVPLPAIWWAVVPGASVQLRILDKTVPHPTYREHAGLMWALNHHKASPPGYGRPWELARDYVGYTPPASGEAANKGFGEPINEDKLRGIDILYIADAYGVYKGDYERFDDTFTHLDFSGRIFGGFNEAEAQVIQRFARQPGRHLVAEFNTLGSPSSASARAVLSELLGVKWTGWTGRYLHDLNDFTEVPHWAPRLYQRFTGKEWAFFGPGILFVHEDNRVFVLRMGSELLRAGPSIQITQPDSALLDGVGDGVPFLFWFDVVEPAGGSKSVAEFHLEVSSEGQKVLHQYGLSESWPAVVQGQEDPLRLYLAGDFSDNELARGPYWLAGWPRVAMLGSTGDNPLDGRSFYFEFFVPLIGNLLDLAEEERR